MSLTAISWGLKMKLNFSNVEPRRDFCIHTYTYRKSTGTDAWVWDLLATYRLPALNTIISSLSWMMLSIFTGWYQCRDLRWELLLTTCRHLEQFWRSTESMPLESFKKSDVAHAVVHSKKSAKSNCMPQSMIGDLCSDSNSRSACLLLGMNFSVDRQNRHFLTVHHQLFWGSWRALSRPRRQNWQCTVSQIWFVSSLLWERQLFRLRGHLPLAKLTKPAHLRGTGWQVSTCLENLWPNSSVSAKDKNSSQTKRADFHKQC